MLREVRCAMPPIAHDRAKAWSGLPGRRPIPLPASWKPALALAGVVAAGADPAEDAMDAAPSLRHYALFLALPGSRLTRSTAELRLGRGPALFHGGRSCRRSQLARSSRRPLSGLVQSGRRSRITVPRRARTRPGPSRRDFPLPGARWQARGLSLVLPGPTGRGRSGRRRAAGRRARYQARGHGR